MNFSERIKANRFACAAVLVVFLAGIFYSFRSCQKHGGDFENYYYGSRFYLEGKFDKDVYECYKFNHLVEQQGEKGLFCNYTPVPPFTVLFFTPFAEADHETSRLLFDLLGLAFFCFALWKFLVHLKVDSVYLLALPVLLFFPVKSNITEGQLYFWLTGFLLFAFLFHDQKKYLLAAVFFALSIQLKIFPALFLVYLLFTPGYRTFVYTLLFSGVFLGILHLAIRHEVLHNYFTQILPRLMRGEINDPFATAFQSSSVFLRQMMVHDADLNPLAWMNTPKLFSALDLFCKLIFILSAIFVSRSRKFAPAIIFMWWMMVMMLMSGYGAEYSLMIWAAIAFTFGISSEKRGMMIFFFIGLLICILPTNFFLHLKFPLNFPRLFLELTLFIIAWLWFRPRLNATAFFITTPLFILMFFLQQRNENFVTTYLNPEEENLLTSYFTSSDDSTLVLSTYGRNGSELKKVKLPGMITQSRFFSTDGHSVNYNGQRLYETKYSILEPAVYDGKLVFLSDEGRGPGMYALRVFDPSPVILKTR